MAKIVKKGMKKVLKRVAPKNKAKVVKRAAAPKRKAVVKKIAKKLMVKTKAVKPTTPQKTLVGVVTHFYDHISVAVIEVLNEIKIGDELEFMGHEHQFKQKVISMQINHNQVQVAKKKQVIGMKVIHPVKAKDLVYK